MSESPAQLSARLRESERLIEAMRLLSRVPSAHTDQARLISELERAISQVMACAHVRLWLLDRQHLHSLTHPHFRVPLPLESHLIGEIALERRALNLKDATRDPRWQPLANDPLDSSEPFSWLCAPMVDRQNGLVGVVELRGSALGYFPPQEERLLTSLCAQAAAMLEQQQLFSGLVTRNYELLDLKLRLEERTAEVELLFELERAAALARSLEEALDGGLTRILSSFQCELTAVLFSLPEERGLRVRRVIGPHAERLTLHADYQDSWLLRVLSQDVSDTRSEWDEEAPYSSDLLTQCQAKTWACVPVSRAGEAPIGALLVINPRRVPSGFDERDLHTLSLIASRMALSHRLATALEEERQAERLSAIGGALSGVIHDLKTPLTLLGGYARALEREDIREERTLLRDAHKRQVAQIQLMIQELLAFARGQREALLRKTLVSPLLEELEELLVAELATYASTHHISLRISRDYAGYARMDAPKLKRALLNLAKNACEAMADQGGELVVRCYDQGDVVYFEVSDTGPGIPSIMRGRLFESFSTHGKESGSGLGLAIVKTIIDQHEGTLAVESSPRGSTFTIGISRS